MILVGHQFTRLLTLGPSLDNTPISLGLVPPIRWEKNSKLTDRLCETLIVGVPPGGSVYP